MLDIRYEPAAQIVTLKVDSDISTRPEPLEDSNSGESKNSPGCIECRKDLSVKTLMRPFVKKFSCMWQCSAFRHILKHEFLLFSQFPSIFLKYVIF